ncbi:hypothetical protein NMY22_g12453 [Coprinellus aureogranulatus]|nr:hypothetical protein NMY22_g12453 [Coprinellus aureogranulatus]
MELHYLEPIDGDWNNEHSEFKPVGKNLLAEEPAHVTVSDEQTERPLGLTLYNDGDVDVYPYLFYFDPNELTITPWALVAEGAGEGQVDPPLLKHSRLAVGYGNGGADPLQFYFEDGKTRDIGFFKLFITCTPANFRCLSQEKSPFPRETRGGDGEEDDRDDGGETEAARLQAEEELKKKLHADQWGVKVATVIQAKG